MLTTNFALEGLLLPVGDKVCPQDLELSEHLATDITGELFLGFMDQCVPPQIGLLVEGSTASCAVVRLQAGMGEHVSL